MYEIEIPIPKIEIVILIRHDDREFAKPHVFFILPNRNQIKNFITTIFIYNLLLSEIYYMCYS